MKTQLKNQAILRIEELEERIAPDGFGPSNNGNPGNEVSNGNSPQPSGGGGNGSGDGNGFGPSDNGNPGNEVSNGNSPQPSGN
ncbi:MAG TPA: hypothetical protein VFU05_02885 [Cyclobacteriaceae bacterium]|nr:hypothetical protein [Cyclobacteriaceae bacterium]